jgi:hypothetical protein
LTAPNTDPRRLRFPQDRTAFVYTGPNAPILTPPQAGLVVYRDPAGTQPANIQTPGGQAIANSTIYIGTDFLLPEFLGPTGHVVKLYARLVGTTGATYPLDAQYGDQIAQEPSLVVGEGPPEDSTGSWGSMYLDQANWLYYGPKTDTWPDDPTPIRGPQGFPGSTYEHTQVSPSTLWTMPHPLGYWPAVTYVDSAGSVVLGDTSYGDGVAYGSFSAPFAGKALMR